MVLEEVAVRTAFFRRESAAEHGPDGWTLQGMNRRTILRYSWRDRLRRMLGKSRSIRRVLSALRSDGQADPEGTPYPTQRLRITSSTPPMMVRPGIATPGMDWYDVLAVLLTCRYGCSLRCGRAA